MGPCCELLVHVIPQLAFLVCNHRPLTFPDCFPVLYFSAAADGNWIEPLGDEWVVPLGKVYPLL